MRTIVLYYCNRVCIVIHVCLYFLLRAPDNKEAERERERERDRDRGIGVNAGEIDVACWIHIKSNEDALALLYH
jgi:hypothetical protein